MQSEFQVCKRSFILLCGPSGECFTPQPLLAHPGFTVEFVTKQHYTLIILLYPGKDMKTFAYYQVT